MSVIRKWLGRPIKRIRNEIATDPVLGFVLLLSILTCGFGIWFRVPNFASADEYSRLVRPMKVAGWTLADPGIESLARGFLDGRAIGASTYLYLLILAPIGLYVFLTGQVEMFANFGSLESRWDLWFAAPDWFWMASILLGRLVVLFLALGSVYLTYLLGRRLGDRTTGRLAALLLGLSLGFVGTAHETGEDIPMLFVLLLALLYLFTYLDSGDLRVLLVASSLGGLAIALKLTAGVIAFAVGAAVLARAHKNGDGDQRFILHASGAFVVGLAAVIVGMPSVLFGGPEYLADRVTGAGMQKVVAQRSDPIWLWLFQKYAEGLGLPLLVATVAGTLATLIRIPSTVREGRYEHGLVVLALLAYLFAFSQWGYVRVHHLLPTFPLLCLVLALETTTKWKPLRWDLPTAGLAVLVVSTALFAAGGALHYVEDPRDQATAWLDEHAEEGATVEVYENSIGEVGVPHNATVSRYDYREDTETYRGNSLVANESAYTEWILSMPDREPEYIQLTATELEYLDSSAYPERREFVRGLLEGEYEYRVVAEFNSGRPDDDGFMAVVRGGTNPVPETVGDRIIILERIEA